MQLKLFRFTQFILKNKLLLVSFLVFNAVGVTIIGGMFNPTGTFDMTMTKVIAIISLIGAVVVAALPGPKAHAKPDFKPVGGGNEPCPCGSGKKFKKCCMPR